MRILLRPDPELTTEIDLTEAAQVLLQDLQYRHHIGLDADDAKAVLPALDALDDWESAQRLAARIRREVQEAEDAQRRRDEWQRTEAERKAQKAKAAAQLAAEMRAKEPALVRAGWTDAELVELNYMRNSGMA